MPEYEKSQNAKTFGRIELDLFLLSNVFRWFIDYFSQLQSHQSSSQLLGQFAKQKKYIK